MRASIVAAIASLSLGSHPSLGQQCQFHVLMPTSCPSWLKSRHRYRYSCSCCSSQRYSCWHRGFQQPNREDTNARAVIAALIVPARTQQPPPPHCHYKRPIPQLVTAGPLETQAVLRCSEKKNTEMLLIPLSFKVISFFRKQRTTEK